MEYLLNQPNSLSDTERERLSNELYEKYKLGLSPVNLLASASLSMHDLIPEKALALASLEPEKSFYIHLNSLHSLDSRNFLDSYLKSSNSDKDKEYVALKLIEYYFNIKEYSLCLRYRSFVDSPLFSLCDQFQSTSDPLAIIKNIASKKDYIHVSTLLLSLQVTCRSILNKFAKEAFSNNSTDAALLMWFHMSCLDEELHLMFHSFSSTRGLEILNSATTSTYDLLSNFANQTSAILSNPQISDFHNMICTLFKPTPTKKDVIPETIQNDTPNLDLIKVKRMFITNIPFSTKPILVERITNLFRSGITVSSYMKSQAKCYTTTATSNLDFQAAILLHSMDRNSGVVSSSAIDTVAAEHIFFQESSRRNVNVTLNVTNLVKLFQMNSKISIFLFEKIIGLLVYDVLKNGKVSLEALILFMNQNIQDQNLNIHNSCAIFGGLVAAIFSSFNKDVLFTGNLDISLQQFTLFATQLCFLIGNCDNHCSLVKIVSVVDDIGLTRFLSACLIAILNSNGENIVHISPLVSQVDLFGYL